MGNTLKIALAMVALLLALATACGPDMADRRTEGDGTATVVGEEDDATTTVVSETALQSALPAPVISLERRGELIEGSRGPWCWSEDGGPDRECVDTVPWYGVDSYAETTSGEPIAVRIDAETRPDKLFAQVHTEPGEIMVDFIRLWAENPVLKLEVGPGEYNVRLIGQWQEGEVSYEFGLRIPGAVQLRAGCETTLIGGDLSLVLDSVDSPERTAIDGANFGGCRFNKPIARVVLTLEGAGSYAETFQIDPPSATIGLPLPEGLASEKTLERLPPGEYSRRMVAVTVDGEEWDITANNDAVVKTVTVADR